MLELNQATAVRESYAGTRTTRHRFVFEGVAFEILAGEGIVWELPRPHDRMLQAVGSAEAIADVVCSVTVDRGRSLTPVADTSDAPSSRLASSHGMRVETPELCIELVALGPARYVATARIAPSRHAALALLCSLVAEVSSRAVG